MEPHLEQANQALFEGDRELTVALLAERARTGAEFWLLAAALQDEHDRLIMLRRAYATGEQPYADMAYAILRREAEFERLLSPAPAWRRWWYGNRVWLTNLIKAVLLMLVALVVLLILRSIL